MIYIVCLVSNYNLAISQEMEVIRVMEKKIVGNQGDDDGVIKNQLYTIYRIMPTGPGSIGSARVSEVKSSVCVLDVLETQSNFQIKNGDILIINDDSQVIPSVETAPTVKPSEGKKSSPYKGKIGIRGGIGTNTSGGILGGGSLSYLVPTYPNPFEIGFLVLSGSIEDKTQDTHTYIARTDILATSLFANYLFNYNYSPQRLFLIIGAGIAFIDVMWERSSETDDSLGKPLPDGGSTQSDEGGRFGILFQFGLGYKFSNTVDTRIEVPILYINNPPGQASSIATTFMFSLGVRFN